MDEVFKQTSKLFWVKFDSTQSPVPRIHLLVKMVCVGTLTFSY